jgi:hypothetical protein
MFCCSQMESAVDGWKKDCIIHSSPFECPDALIARMRNGNFGIIYHDGGSSVNEIEYCPWCGKKFLSQKRV